MYAFKEIHVSIENIRTIICKFDYIEATENRKHLKIYL